MGSENLVISLIFCHVMWREQIFINYGLFVSRVGKSERNCDFEMTQITPMNYRTVLCAMNINYCEISSNINLAWGGGRPRWWRSGGVFVEGFVGGVSLEKVKEMVGFCWYFGVVVE